MDTWHLLRTGHEMSLLPGEETLTDLNLIRLKEGAQSNVRIAKHSKAQESKTGADFELWLGSERSWTGLRIQAKKVNPATVAFDDFSGKAKREKALSQAGRLIHGARTMDSVRRKPVYLFYAYWDGAHHAAPNVRADSEQYGCSLCSAFEVLPKLAAGEVALDKYMPVTPWERLVCRAEGVSLGDHASAVLDELTAGDPVFRAEPGPLPRDVARLLDAGVDGAQPLVDEALEALEVNYLLVCSSADVPDGRG